MFVVSTARRQNNQIFKLQLVQAVIGTRAFERWQFISGAVVTLVVAPRLVSQLAHSSLAGLPRRHSDQVPSAQHGHPMAEGRRTWLEGSHRHEGGLKEPVPICSSRSNRGQGESFFVIVIVDRCFGTYFLLLKSLIGALVYSLQSLIKHFPTSCSCQSYSNFMWVW